MMVQSSTLPDPCLKWLVRDSHFARAYSRTGDWGRAVIKSAIARLYPARPGLAHAGTSFAARHQAGGVRTTALVPRSVFILALDPAVSSPAQVVSAVMPAMVARIPLVAVLRLKSRAPWPDAVLAALELCGVEHVLSVSRKYFKQCFSFIMPEHPRGGFAFLGGEKLWKLVRDLPGPGWRTHWLPPPDELGVLRNPSLDWDMPAIQFAHAGVALHSYPDAARMAEAGCGAVFAPQELAPAGASLVIEPGSEAVWDWPGLPAELFFAERLVYS